MQQSGDVAVQGRKLRYLFMGAVLVALAACTTTRNFRTDDIPAALKASGKVLLMTHAKGVQIYQCKLLTDDETRADWVLKAPEAALFDAHGRKVGFHFAGPTWQFEDGSQIVGEVSARWKSPDTDSIPWLLLKTKSTSGRNRAGKIESIQRLHTAGGNAPAGCMPNQVGQEARVDYTADYYFSGAARP